MIIQKVWKNKSNQQKLITIPKDCEINEGDLVEVKKTRTVRRLRTIPLLKSIPIAELRKEKIFPIYVEKSGTVIALKEK